MPNKNDLRFKRTETAIRRAFLSIAGGGNPNPSVIEICERAKISRNAFYLHYAGVPTLCQSLVDEIAVDIRMASAAFVERFTENRASDSLLAVAIAEALARHETVLRALLPAAGGTIAAYLAKSLEDVYMDVAQPIITGNRERGHRLACAWGAWALIGFTLRWFEETDRPLSEASTDFIRLQQPLTDAAAAYLGGQ